MERKKFIKVLGVSSLGFGMIPFSVVGLNEKRSHYETCKVTWEKLCGNIGEVYKNDAFKYIHPTNIKPNVLLYGDSISIKYTPEARSVLQEQATVFRLFKNGGSSNHFISNMDKMNEVMFKPNLKRGWNFKWDIIHFNVGLHDLKYLKGKHLNIKGKQVSSISVYKNNLDVICNYLKFKYPKAKLIFATTTPVPENAKGRLKGDSVKFNQVALEVLNNHPDIVINDLYKFTLPHLEKWAKKPGDVHYNELGFNEQGKEVGRVIAENL